MQLPSPAGWAGLFLFAVGIYGGTYLPITRHLTLGGVVPLDWFFWGLIVTGGTLMLFDTDKPHPEAEAGPLEDDSSAPPTLLRRLLHNVWRGFSWGALASIAYWAIAR
jgi:hypothetical protein